MSKGTPSKKRNGRQGCRHSQNALELWREWALVGPVSQEEGPCCGISDHSEPSGQPRHHCGWRNWKLRRPCVSEGIPEPRVAGDEICSVGIPSVHEGEFVDIEVDSSAEVSCLLASIGAGTYPLHETRLSMSGGHHVAAGGGKLHELGASDVRGDVVNSLVRFRAMDIGKALLSTQNLSRCPC